MERNILNEIDCSVGLDFTRGWHLVDEKRFYNQLTKEAVVDLKNMGLKVNAHPPGRIEGLGGGGWDIAFLIQNVIKLASVAKALAAMAGFVSNLYAKALHAAHLNSKQRILINLDLRYDKRLEEENMYLIQRKAAIAFDGGAIIQRRLAKKYPLYDVKLVVSVSLPKNGLNVSYTIDNVREKAAQRVSRVIRAGSFNSGDNLIVELTRFGIIKHIFSDSTEILDSPFGPNDWRHMGLPERTYFTYVSSSMYRGYKRKSRSTTWDEFLESNDLN